MIRRHLPLLVVACIVTILGGCAVKSIDKNFALENASSTGMIILSTSHDEAGGRATKSISMLKSATGESIGTIQSLPDAIPGIPGGSDLEDGYGKILALALPAGSYRINGWQIVYGSGVRVTPIDPPDPLTFELAAGEVKYLGNLHANLMMGKNIFRMKILGDGYVGVYDQHERDIAFIEEKYPQLKGKIGISLLRQGPWLNGVERDRTVAPLPPIQPIPVRH